MPAITIPNPVSDWWVKEENHRRKKKGNPVDTTLLLLSCNHQQRQEKTSAQAAVRLNIHKDKTKIMRVNTARTKDFGGPHWRPTPRRVLDLSRYVYEVSMGNSAGVYVIMMTEILSIRGQFISIRAPATSLGTPWTAFHPVSWFD